MAGKIKYAWLIGSLAVPLLLATGCGPAGQISLIQPQLTGWQRVVRLKSNDIHWAEAEGVNRVLAEFPLPGAQTGRPTYLLYLRMPNKASTASFEGSTNPKKQGLGFMIQTRGEYAGLALLSGGTVRMHGASPLGSDTRRFDVDLTCEDGTQIAGTLTATRDDYLLSRFETKRRPADIQALQRSSEHKATATPHK